jgi:hypothetical protein
MITRNRAMSKINKREKVPAIHLGIVELSSASNTGT